VLKSTGRSLYSTLAASLKASREPAANSRLLGLPWTWLAFCCFVNPFGNSLAVPYKAAVDSLDPAIPAEVPPAQSPALPRVAPPVPWAARPWLAFPFALAVSLLAAVAVDFGFRAAFVSDAVAWGTTAYASALVVLFAGRDRNNPHIAHRPWVRVPLALAVTGVCLLLLRGPLLYPLALGSFTTTGHSPYVVLPVSALLSLLLLWGFGRVPLSPSSLSQGRSS
jgi:hypothetical protein